MPILLKKGLFFVVNVQRIALLNIRQELIVLLDRILSFEYRVVKSGHFPEPREHFGAIFFVFVVDKGHFGKHLYLFI